MTEMLRGLMQDEFPLTLHHILNRVRRCNRGAELVTLRSEGVVQRAEHAELADRIDRLARGLRALGVQQGDRGGTFAWNNQRHFELYFAIPCICAVLHTLNIRLFEEQLTYIVNHAEDKVIFVDASLVPTLERLAPSFTSVTRFVLMGEGEQPQLGRLTNALSYEELMEEAGPGGFDYPQVDERQGGALRFTRRAHRKPE